MLVGGGYLFRLIYKMLVVCQIPSISNHFIRPAVKRRHFKIACNLFNPIEIVEIRI